MAESLPNDDQAIKLPVKGITPGFLEHFDDPHATDSPATDWRVTAQPADADAIARIQESNEAGTKAKINEKLIV